MASPANKKYFKNFQTTVDPASYACFECGDPNPQWCDVWHGTFICLNCAGTHRGLGVHLSFVRSLGMDAWQPDKLAMMKVGGNGKAKVYFQKHGIADLPIKQKYETPAALMYMDKIKAESKGEPFDEKSWKAPEMKKRADPSRFQGMGSQPQRTQPDPSDQVATALTGAWAGLTAAATKAADATTKAAQAASKATAEASANVAASTKKGMEGFDMDKTVGTTTKAAAESWGKLASSTKAGWGTFTSWSKSVLDQAAGGNEEDGLASALGNLEVKKSNYEGMTNADATGPATPVSNIQSNTSPVRSSPDKTSPDGAAAGGDDWGWGSDDNKEDSGGSQSKLGSSTTSTNSNSLSSSAPKKKGLGLAGKPKSKGASLSSLKAAKSKKAE